MTYLFIPCYHRNNVDPLSIETLKQQLPPAMLTISFSPELM